MFISETKQGFLQYSPSLGALSGCRGAESGVAAEPVLFAYTTSSGANRSVALFLHLDKFGGGDDGTVSGAGATGGGARTAGPVIDSGATAIGAKSPFTLVIWQLQLESI